MIFITFIKHVEIIPLCFLLLPKFFRLLLKSRIFSLTAYLIFQFFVGEAWGERRIIFWKFKENQNFVFLLCLHVCCCLLLFAFVPQTGLAEPEGERRIIFWKPKDQNYDPFLCF